MTKVIIMTKLKERESDEIDTSHNCDIMTFQLIKCLNSHNYVMSIMTYTKNKSQVQAACRKMQGKKIVVLTCYHGEDHINIF